MRVLLDESLPRRLTREFTEHQVITVRQQGWQGVKNGELLRRAKTAGFEVFITADQNLEYQQNLRHIEISIIVLYAISNSIEDLLPLIPEIRTTLSTIRPNQLVRVGESR